MSLDLSAKLGAIVAWASSITGLTVIRSHQNSPRPGLPFGRVQLLSSTSPGTASTYSKEGAPTVQVHKRWSTMVVQFSFHGGDPRQECQKLLEALELESTNVTLNGNGIGIGPTSQITDVPQIRDNGWEEMATLDVTFHVAAEFEETVGYIETVPTSSTFS